MNFYSRRRQSSKQRMQRRGAATVEAAVCLPILVVLTLGVVEACDAIFTKQGLLVCAFEGARVAVVAGSKPENVEAQIMKIANERSLRSVSFDIVPANFSNLPPGAEVTVNVRAPAKDNCFFGMGFFASKTLQASSTFTKDF